jgi:cell division septal protein FtsQ
MIRLTEPDTQFRRRKRKTLATLISRILISALMILMMPLLIYSMYRSLEPIGIVQIIIMILVVSVVLCLVLFILYWMSWILIEFRRLKPISVSGNQITLNSQYSINLDDIQGIDRHSPWNELRFRLTDKNTVIIIMENKFVSDLLEKYKDKWSIWNYSDNKHFQYHL